jgi:hypothetical protein
MGRGDPPDADENASTIASAAIPSGLSSDTEAKLIMSAGAEPGFRALVE